MRRVLIATAAATALLGVPASGATVPCTVVTDAAGDAETAPGVGDPYGDLLSVGAASDARTLTLSVHVAEIEATGTPVGHMFNVQIDDGEVGYSVDASLNGGHPTYHLFQQRAVNGTGSSLVTADLGPLVGHVDAVQRTITVHVPLKSIRWSTGHRFDLSAIAWRAVGEPTLPGNLGGSVIVSVDFTESAKVRLGSPHCH